MKKIFTLILLVILFVTSCEGEIKEIKIDNLSDTLTLKKSLVCPIQGTDPTGKIVKTTIYIEDKKARIETDYTNEKTYTIYTKKLLYVWGDASNQGEILNLEFFEELQGKDYDEVQSLKEYLDGIDESSTMREPNSEVICKIQYIDPSQFVPPSNIDFKDMVDELGSALEQVG